MFICKNCDAELNEGELVMDFDRIGEAWGRPADEERYCCPRCGFDEFVELTGRELTIYNNIAECNWEQSYTRIICPYCGYAEDVESEMYFGDDDVDVHKEGEQELTCPECCHKFKLIKKMEWNYTTEILEDKYEIEE